MNGDRYLAAVNVLGHELRRPLTVIRGAATLLLQAAGEMQAESHDEMLALIDSNVEEMGDMIEDLIAAAHVEAGDLRPDLEPLDAGALVSRAVARARRADPEREVEVVSLQPGVDVVADPGYAERAVRALVVNALVHTPAGSPVEVVAVGAGSELRIEVRDRGPGLPAEQFEPAFELFRTLDGRRPGIGAGLFVARGLAQAMGGGAGLEPRPDGGLIAWCTFMRRDRGTGQPA